MAVSFHLRPIAAALIAALSVQSGEALASTAGANTVSASQSAPTATTSAATTLVEFAVGDEVVAVHMPCNVLLPGPGGGEDFQSKVCIDGDQLYVFAVAEGEGSTASAPMDPDFDAAYEEIEKSADTTDVDVEDVDGRRTMRAVRGPDPDFGIMQAVEMREDAVVYVIAMSRPNRVEPLDDATKQIMRDFVNSLEIGE